MSDQELTYRTAVDKGQELFYAFLEPVTQSVWHDYDFLRRCGWAIGQRVNWPPRPEERAKLIMYRDLGLSVHPDDNKKVDWKHMYDSWPQGEHYPEYRCTFGFYNCIYNPLAITAQYSESPDWAGDRLEVRGDDVIALKHWSDVVFLEWQQFCGNDPNAMHQLSYIIQSEVTNKTTIRIVETALAKAGLESQLWAPATTPDKKSPKPPTFPIDSYEGQAILATPNGVGPAHLLSQHKEQLGRLMIFAVTVFHRLGFGVNPDPMSLLFHVVPVDEWDEECGRDYDPHNGAVLDAPYHPYDFDEIGDALEP